MVCPLKPSVPISEVHSRPQPTTEEGGKALTHDGNTWRTGRTFVVTVVTAMSIQLDLVIYLLLLLLVLVLLVMVVVMVTVTMHVFTRAMYAWACKPGGQYVYLWPPSLPALSIVLWYRVSH